ncbi:MAG: efflux RND transporter periplasmic adaptor subunit [Acidobacteria bacterium]|nr:efflux RND transporter periplasmic adaptor subunit [Acidobacteriota bacterium]NIM60941.1 efflux RND transporter periplasmic adaptor subunit [Acidobacteriota bacterium]NIO58009.1 efflux RND transporter periplasmic adaptor subunit [Acidobacteriota bacterium]NIQ29016.1 efflux RND transporter periplasmic adaptor subunit [Acidobacteriota bacterium]NIQ83540.1 efflux RND transporter periplasmic adaptor subunit [Acidobacteriota bacterium]
MRRFRWVGIGIVLVVVILFVLGRSGDEGQAVELAPAESRDLFRSFVNASGEILAERYADIGSSVMGRVVELPVTEGAEVQAGDLLARIDPIQARSELEAAEAAIQAFAAEAASAAEQVVAARADLERATAEARESSINLERLETLFREDLVSASEMDAARAAAESRNAGVDAAQAAVTRAESSGEAARRRVLQARAQAARARDLLEKTSIVAPISGVVSRLQVRQGEMVVIGIQNQPGTVLMTVSDLSELNAEVKVAEADVLRVAVGQEATVTLEALPDRAFRGRVTEVGASALPQLTAGAAAREFRVEIRLLDAVPNIRPGLTCDAEILVGEQDDVVVVPLQSVVIRTRDDGGETRGVFTVSQGAARFIEVETGMIGGLDIVVHGIEAGSEVIVGPYQILRGLEDGDRVRTP